MSQGSPELIRDFGPLITNCGVLGCYLQTELGHGTNVAGLETTATYIPETKEFEIHSPTLTSSKWWIGALGKTATHGVVQAKLIIGGKDYGPHLFFVQLRSMGMFLFTLGSFSWVENSLLPETITRSFLELRLGILVLNPWEVMPQQTMVLLVLITSASRKHRCFPSLLRSQTTANMSNRPMQSWVMGE